MVKILCHLVLWCIFSLLLTGDTNGAFSRQRVQLFPASGSGEIALSAFSINPADLARIRRTAGIISYTNLFGLKELQNSQAGVIHNFSGKYFGAGFSMFGNDIYSERTVSLGYGMSVSSEGALGIGIHGYELSIDGYGSARSWGLDLGTRWSITDAVDWEIAYANLNNPTIGQSNEQLPQQIFTAVTYSPLKNLQSRLSLIQNIRYLPRFGVDLSYEPLRWISLSAGVNTEPLNSIAGISLRWQTIQVHYVFSSHASGLPYTHRFSLGIMY